MLTIKTLVFAPYPGLAQLTSELTSELSDFDITVVQGDLSEVLPELRKSEENGYDMIISRGGTAKLIRQHTSLPVVEIPVSGYDIMRMIALVKGYEAKFEMIGFSNIIENVADVAGLMKVEFQFQTIRDESEVDAAIRRAKERGVMIVVGDTITVRRAKASGLQGVLITSGKESVLDAFSRAKQIYRSITFYKNSNLVYRQMIARSHHGAAIFSDDGKLLESNSAFRQLLTHGRVAFLQELIMQLGEVTDLAVAIKEDGLYYLTGECLYMGDQKIVYLLIRPIQKGMKRPGLTLCAPGEFVESFPPLITSHPDSNRLLDEMRLLSEQSSLIVLCGERGVGKRLLVTELLSGNSEWLEVSLMSNDRNALVQLEHLMNRTRRQYIHLRLADEFDDSVQQWLVEILSKGDHRLILSFETHPKLLLSQGRMNGTFYKLIKDRIVIVPPLRESLINLEECIRTFIVKFNEKYGKQIVGLRPTVKAALLDYKWPGNLIELRNFMENAIRRTQGAYMEEDVLRLLEEMATEERDSQRDYVLDLHQPLDEIERDIINIVLAEEGLNQTKAAERLGINRSTLWRKLRSSP